MSKLFNKNKRASSSSPGGPGGSSANPSKKDKFSGASNIDTDITEGMENKPDQLGNLSKEAVAKIASSHDENTYASAASTPEVDMKNLVYIQKGREGRAAISKMLFLAFMEKLQNTIAGLPEEDFGKINIAWSDHDLGRGLVASMDQDTTAFVKREAEAFECEGQTIRGWTRNEFGTQIVYQGFLHNIIWADKKLYTGPKAIAMILRKNGLINAGKFQVISWQKQKNGVFTRFECDEGLAMALDSHGLSLRAGICRLVLTKKIITSKVVEEADPDNSAVAKADESASTSSKNDNN